MAGAKDRFNKRRALSKAREPVDDKKVVRVARPMETSAEVILASSRLEMPKDTDIDAMSADALLAEIHGHLNAEKIDALLDSCQRECLQAVIRPLGLGKVLFEDKLGGNVTTTHNFEKGITATESDRARYLDWGNRKSMDTRERRKPYLKDYAKKKNRDFKNGAPEIIDQYTGQPLEKNTMNVHWEHVVPVINIENSPSFNLRMTEQERVALANADENKTYTTAEINLKKNDKDLMNWYGSLPKEERTSMKLDKGKVSKAYQRSKKHVRAEEAKAWIKKDGLEISTTGFNEGGRMALQQALGVLIEEFVRAAFDEVKDVWKTGFRGKVDDDFLDVLKARLMRVAKRVQSKWKDATYALRDGFLSGFLSNLVTVLINMFATTAARLVRMIREGFMSLYHALKTLAFPEEGVTMAEAADAAVKLLAAGLVTAGGIALEAALDPYLKSLGPLADVVLSVSVGLATGVATACTIYLLDEIDLFGVHAKIRHEKVLDRLNEAIDISYEQALKSAQVFEGPFLPHLK